MPLCREKLDNALSVGAVKALAGRVHKDDTHLAARRGSVENHLANEDFQRLLGRARTRLFRRFNLRSAVFLRGRASSSTSAQTMICTGESSGIS